MWQVLGEGAAASRFEARRIAGLTPFVGREPELERLLDCWRKAKRSEGQVVLVSGEPASASRASRKPCGGCSMSGIHA